MIVALAIQFIKAKPRYNEPMICINKTERRAFPAFIYFNISIGKKVAANPKIANTIALETINIFVLIKNIFRTIVIIKPNQKLLITSYITANVSY